MKGNITEEIFRTDHSESEYVGIFKELTDVKFALDESAIVAITDQRGKITFINDKFCEISKFDREELLGQDHRIINSGFHSKEFIRDLWKTITSGKTWRGEICNRAKDNSVYWVDTTIVPFLNSEGKPYQYIAIRHEITERKLTEAALAENEERYRQLFDSNPLPVWVFDTENLQILAANEAAIKLYGYTREEFLGMTTKEIRPPEEIPKLLETIQNLKDQKVLKPLAFRHQKKSGEIIDVEVSYHSIIFEGRDAFFAIGQDITERKLSEERIRQQTELLDKTQDAILVCDLNYRILYWNKGSERLYGWKSEEVLGKGIGEILCKEDDTQLRTAQKTLAQKDEFKIEASQTTRNDKTVFVRSRWNLVRNDLNQPDYFLIINTDISEQTKIEEHLLRAQRMESIGTLAGGIAHDLNNILSPILMATYMLSINSTDEDSKRWLSIVKQNAERGADLVRQVLSFARGIEGERVSVQLKHIVKELVKVLQETFPKSITVKFNIEPELTVISADPTQIHQVLMNLCVNARDAMLSGGLLKISVKNIVLDDTYVQMNLEAETGNYIVISVSDTGSGMSSEVIKRIFDPFFTTKEIGKGTGLGLATTLSIVKSHGGFVNVFSEIGKGTEFSVYLPASGNEQALGNEQSKPTYSAGSGELILVVDDEENILQVTQATLEKFGYRVLTATDGTEALAVFAENRNEIALVLTDMMMPFMDGPATIRALRKLNPTLKIIAASGLSTNEQSSDLTNLKVNAFLAKPYTAEKLLTTLDQVLQKT
jgi:PAS domain S-box-containing protein